MNRLLVAMLCLPAAILLASCASPTLTQSLPVFPPGYVEAWEAAVVDARNPTPAKIDPHLTPIEGNPDIVRKSIGGQEHILVVSWKSKRAYYPSVFYPDPKSKFNVGKYPIWVTVAPQIQQVCRGYLDQGMSEQQLVLRLRQLLGLEPGTEEVFFLEVWARPGDLWRPCADNETSDTVCGLSLPAKVSDDYRAWFNDTRAVQYVDCGEKYDTEQLGYPWTQLGYTYDWNPDNKSHRGLSEFVIKPNADVYVAAEPATVEYCSSYDLTPGAGAKMTSMD